MSVLLTGGTGYIGAHVAAMLHAAGEPLVILDDVATGVRERVTGIPLIELELSSAEARQRLPRLLREHEVDAVIHFAARKRVGESVAEPVRYYRENLGGLVNLLEALETRPGTSFVFSSSASVYGQGRGAPIREDDPTEPLSPYGQTKLAGEWLIEAAGRSQSLRAVSLRYFNVAGAAEPRLADRVALNLIPMVFERLLEGRRPVVFGDDYPTPDGTCIRDYIHVGDLAEAHVRALHALRAAAPLTAAYNVGTGQGYSVLEVVRTIGEVTGLDVTPEIAERRPGDPARIVADAGRIRQDLGWSADHGLHEMVDSAWRGFRAARG